MKTPWGEYRLHPGEGNDWLSLRAPMDYTPTFGGGDGIRTPPDNDAEIGALKGVATLSPMGIQKVLALTKAAPAPAFQADVMFIYTTDLATKLGAGLFTMLNNLIATANQSYADSEVALSLRLVNATMLDLPNSATSDDTLMSMRNAGTNSALFQALTWQPGTSVRDLVGADIVALVRDGPNDTGGIGFLLSNPTIYPAGPTVTSSNAYSVNNYCASGCESIFTHELGHNMGNAHDRATVAVDGGGTVPQNGVFAYSFGHNYCVNGYTCNPFSANGPLTCPVSTYAACSNRQPNDFGTVMSYVGPRVMKFSNPNILCMPSGGVVGLAQPCGLVTQDDNALSMNNVRHNIAAYRSQVLATLPGSLQFTKTGYSGLESGAVITFTVSRTGGSSGAVSVNYALAPGTATAGVDYLDASGTLNWANGESADKTFSVTIVNGALVEGNESFTASLSSPVGAAGVYLGYPTTATGLIHEPWPPGGTVPAGYNTAPGGSSVPWAVATDSSYDGDGFSLKSGAIDFAVSNRLCSDPSYGAVPCPSILQTTASFLAGTISYAFRVNSYPNNGFLEFMIDGVVVQKVSGTNVLPTPDTGWLTFSTPVTA